VHGGLALAKAVTNEPQPAILASTPVQGRYLTCQLRVGAHRHTVLRQRATQAVGASTVIGLGASP
jgi:putative iron-dependent peroxidase